VETRFSVPRSELTLFPGAPEKRVGRPGAEVARAMAEHKVYIGRVWPIWPAKVRVSVCTQDEMNTFTAALVKVMA
jgi:histidinol-phosphate/aromatic aminotransferase/cobyric acid decarboxylase-like protein